jgi:tRNA nucleotidyltransferase (CCA-adding enzyme)
MGKMKKDEVIGKVLKKILPTHSEASKLEKLAERTLEVVDSESSKYGAHAMLAGSLTRDTWLTGKREFDVFVLFPEHASKEDMESKGLQIGKDSIKKLGGKFHMEYAEHPYVCGRVNGIDIDVVPCFEISSTEKLKSSVDRTPFHVRFIERCLRPDQSKEVRLLKQFCKANGIYGADAKTEGLSGYVCELLVIKYGSFLGVLEGALGWHAGYVIDIESFYKKEEYAQLKKTFKGNTLILIDPTDRMRNTSAALSCYNFQKLRSVAKKFLDNPSEKMFFAQKIKPLSLKELAAVQKKRESEIVVVVIGAPKVVPDILWPQLRRFAQRLEMIMKENDFDVMRKDVYSDEEDFAAVLLEMETHKLPAVRKRTGPSIFDEHGARGFLGKYKSSASAGPFIEGEYWTVETMRSFRTAKEKLKDSLSDPLKELEAKGVPNFIAKQVKRKFKVLDTPKDIISMARMDKDFGVFLRLYFEKESLA